MRITELRSYEDLERYLREFINASGDPVPYDFIGAVYLLKAILGNLRQYALEGELEDVGRCFSAEEIAFLQRLTDYVVAGPVDPDAYDEDEREV